MPAPRKPNIAAAVDARQRIAAAKAAAKLAAAGWIVIPPDEVQGGEDPRVGMMRRQLVDLADQAERLARKLREASGLV